MSKQGPEDHAAIYPPTKGPKTPYHAAYVLAYESIEYGSLIEESEGLKKTLQEAIFQAARPIFEDVWNTRRAPISEELRERVRRCLELRAHRDIGVWVKHEAEPLLRDLLGDEHGR